MISRFLSFFALCFTLTSYCLGATIELLPENSYVDESFSLKVENLNPLSSIIITTKTVDRLNVHWSSKAHFQSNEEGILNIEDASFLIANMKPEKVEAGIFVPPLESLNVTFKITDAHQKLIAHKTYTRHMFNPNIERIRMSSPHLKAWLYIPEKTEHNVVVICIPGSTGGYNGAKARLIASKGIPCLAVAYFGKKDLPQNLVNVPLEYFIHAIGELQKYPATKDRPIVLLGESRGSEACLLLASLYPSKIQGVVAYSPTDAVWGGLPQYNRPAWSYQKNPLPFILIKKESADYLRNGTTPRHARSSKKISEDAILASDPSNFIKIENTTCPILLISGDDDEIWDSTKACYRLIKRFEEYKGHHENLHHIHYPQAGHMISFPGLPFSPNSFWHPLTQSWFLCGGSSAGNYKASKDSWKQIFNFLTQTEFANTSEIKK